MPNHVNPTLLLDGYGCTESLYDPDEALLRRSEMGSSGAPDVKLSN